MAVADPGNPNGPQARVSEWRRGFPVAIVGALGTMLGSAHIYTFGTFVEPLEAEFGWTRTQIASGLLLAEIATVLCVPLVGFLLDRFGSRRFALVGVPLFGGAFAMLAQAGPDIWSWRAGWILLALSALMIKPAVWAKAVAGHFTRQRGLALGIMLSGTSICGAILPVTAGWLIETEGWRTAYLALGLAFILVTWPLLFLFFRDPEGLRAEQRVSPLAALRFALSPTFLKILVGTFLFTLSVAAVTISYVPILTSKGAGLTEAAAITGIVGASSFVGRLTMGLLLDRISSHFIGAAAFAVPMVGFALLFGLPFTWTNACLTAAVLGFSMGAEIDVVAYMLARYFGTQYLGTLLSTVFGFVSLGLGIGPLVLSVIFDTTGAYDEAVFWVVPTLIAAVLLMATLRPYPDVADAAVRRQQIA